MDLDIEVTLEGKIILVVGVQRSAPYVAEIAKKGLDWSQRLCLVQER